MADWRIRGFVPDSDDEEESLIDLRDGDRRDEAEIGSQHKAPGQRQFSNNAPTSTLNNDTIISTASQLEQLLNHGLQAVRDVLGASPIRESFSEGNGDDSPLSSVPASPLTLSPKFTSSLIDLEPSNNVSSNSIHHDHNESTLLPRRNLRARAPIQQHPYMLENAHYRELMKARGLKPVAAPAASRDADQRIIDEETQQTEDFQSSQPEDSYDFQVPSSPTSTPSEAENQDSVTKLPVQDLLEFDGDDGLPDLSQILRARDQGSKKLSRTKSKTLRHQQKQTPLKPAILNIFDISDHETETERSPRQQPFRVPPSPPHSYGYLISDDSDNEPIKESMRRSSSIAQNLPTPLTSSGLKILKRPQIVVSSSEASQSSSDEQESDASETSNKDDSQGMLEIRRLLKGKLPASHIRLNAQDQPRDVSKIRPHTGLGVAIPTERGVARRKQVAALRSRGQNMLHLSDLESSDSDSLETARLIQPANSTRTPIVSPAFEQTAVRHDDFEHDDWIVADAEEEDQVDPMLPPSGIRHNSNRQKYQRQKRLDDGWGISYHRTRTHTAAADSNAPRTGALKLKRTRAVHTKRKKTKHRQQALGIKVTDAPGLRSVNRQSQPQFLKVAARQARQRFVEPYQDPSMKFFVLATEEDTNDVNDQIEAWRENRSLKTHKAPVVRANVFNTTTGPAASKSKHVNTSIPTPRPSTRDTFLTDIRTLKESSHALLTRISERDSEALHRNSTVSGTLSSTTPDQKTQRSRVLHLRSLFAHRNRSGQGQLLSRVMQSRQAQLEDIQPSSRPILVKVPIRTIAKPRKLSEPQPTNLPEMADPIVKTFTRRPRKQIPERYTAPQTHEPRSLKSATEYNRHAVRSAADHVNNLNALRRNKFPQPFKVDALLTRLRTLGKNSSENTGESQPSLTLVTAISLQTIVCGPYDAHVKSSLSTVFDEIEQAFLGDNHPAWRKCLESLDSISAYFANLASFENNADDVVNSTLIDAVQDCASRIEHWSTPSATIDLQTVKKRNHLLRCLTRMSCIAYNLHILARSINHALAFQTQDLCKSLIQRSFQIIMEPAYLVPSLEHFQPICNELAPFEADWNSPAADFILVAWTIFHGLEGTTAKSFFEPLKPIIMMISKDDWTTQLALIILTLCLVVPLIVHNHFKMLFNIPYDVEGVSDACFDLLVTHIRSLSSQFPSGRAPPAVGKLLAAAEDLILKFIHIWKWTPPTSVAISIFRAYNWNAMLPFHETPDSATVFSDLECLSTDPSFQIGNDFFKFLQIVEASIECYSGPQNDIDDHATRAVGDPAKLRGFVFSLLPNKARYHDGQDILEASQFLALKNHFALYIMLFKCIPEGFQPTLMQLERQVDFTTSHLQVCKLAAQSWYALFRYHLQRTNYDRDLLIDLSHWFDTMLRQTMASFEIHQQFHAIEMLNQLMLLFAKALTVCDTEPKAQLVITRPTLRTITLLLTQFEIHQGNDKVILAGVKLLGTYAHLVQPDLLEHSLIIDIQSILKTVIQLLLSANRSFQTDVIKQLMQTWFEIANCMVVSKFKNWNDFLEPHSNLSIDFLSGHRDTHTALDMKQCFYLHMMTDFPSHFLLEFRPALFTTWVAALLLPVHSMRFQAALTNSILRTERDSLSIFKLVKRLNLTKKTVALSLQDVINLRIVILGHIIQYIYGQQANPESDWLAGGLEAENQKELLRAMMRTMKLTWLELKEDPVAQNDYTIFIHAIITEMEMYPVKGVKIGQFFTVEGGFPRSEHLIDNVFRCRFGEEGGEVTKDLIHDFRLRLTSAIDSDKMAILEKDLLRAFHCEDPMRKRFENGRTEYSFDLAKQAKFMQLVFPAYINLTIKEYLCTVGPVMRLLTEMSRRILFRFDDLDPVGMNQYVKVTATILCSIRRLFQAKQLVHPASLDMVRYIRVAYNSVYAILDYGIEIEEEIYEMFVKTMLRLYVFLTSRLDLWNDIHYSQSAVAATAATTVAAASETPYKTTDPRVEVDRTNSVYDEWLVEKTRKDWGLVPAEMEWFLCEPVEEPVLTEEEARLREWVVGDLKLWSGVAWRGVARPPWEALGKETLGLVREMRERPLYYEE